MYTNLIKSRSALIRSGYLEKHHIAPTSLGGADLPENIVRLTAREHFIAHRLLPRFLFGIERCKMLLALNFLAHGNKQHRAIKLTSSTYEEVRRALSEANKSRPKQPMSEQTKKKISEANTGKKRSERQRNKMRNRVCSSETRQKISVARTGQKLSLETIAKISIKNIGRKHPTRSEEWKVKQRAAQAGRRDTSITLAKKSKAQSGENNPRAKIWKLETTDGRIFEVKALKPWCVDQGISYNMITRRTGKFYSGFRLYNDVSKTCE